MSVRILQGDVREVLRTLPADHFDCVVTSPPYWGLRAYLRDDHPDKSKEMGLEPTLGEHIATLVEVFREVRRVLKPTGTCWLNYGDCYATAPNGRSAADTKAAGNDDRTFRDKPFSTIGPIYGPPSDKSTLRGNGHIGGGPKLHQLRMPPPARGGPVFAPGVDPNRAGTSSTAHSPNTASDHGGRIWAGGTLKPKDLCLIPQRLAIALQDDGWWIRSLMPWVKRNGMPESITDRPATSIEYVIFMTKSERYAYDAEAVRKAASLSTNMRVSQDVANQVGSMRANGSRKTNGPMKAIIRSPKLSAPGSGTKSNQSFEDACCLPVADRNFRNSDLFFESLEAPFGLLSDEDGTPLAIDANPQGFREAHFATFPPKLVEPLLKAGAPAHGCCVACGKPWRRTIEKGEPDEAHRQACGADASGGYNGHATKDFAMAGAQDASAVKARILNGMRERITSWEPSCRCEQVFPLAKPRALDPFGGAGTVGLVADRLGLDCTLIELNQDSIDIGSNRLTKDAGMFADVTAA